jgi:hypothetical protein
MSDYDCAKAEQDRKRRTGTSTAVAGKIIFVRYCTAIAGMLGVAFTIKAGAIRFIFILGSNAINLFKRTICSIVTLHVQPERNNYEEHEKAICRATRHPAKMTQRWIFSPT